MENYLSDPMYIDHFLPHLLKRDGEKNKTEWLVMKNTGRVFIDFFSIKESISPLILLGEEEHQMHQMRKKLVYGVSHFWYRCKIMIQEENQITFNWRTDAEVSHIEDSEILQWKAHGYGKRTWTLHRYMFIEHVEHWKQPVTTAYVDKTLLKPCSPTAYEFRQGKRSHCKKEEDGGNIKIIFVDKYAGEHAGEHAGELAGEHIITEYPKLAEYTPYWNLVQEAYVSFKAIRSEYMSMRTALEGDLPDDVFKQNILTILGYLEWMETESFNKLDTSEKEKLKDDISSAKGNVNDMLKKTSEILKQIDESGKEIDESGKEIYKKNEEIHKIFVLLKKLIDKREIVEKEYMELKETVLQLKPKKKKKKPKKKKKSKDKEQDKDAKTNMLAKKIANDVLRYLQRALKEVFTNYTRKCNTDDQEAGNTDDQQAVANKDLNSKMEQLKSIMARR